VGIVRLMELIRPEVAVTRSPSRFRAFDLARRMTEEVRASEAPNVIVRRLSGPDVDLSYASRATNQ
jgi:hypothetical protein